MTKDLNRTCTTCQQKYRYCPSCYEDQNKPTWMVLFHDENCKRIYTYANDYAHGDMTKEDAKVLLNECDLTNLENFHPVVKKTIMEIIATDEQPAFKPEQKKEDSEQAESEFTEKKFSKKNKKIRY